MKTDLYKYRVDLAYGGFEIVNLTLKDFKLCFAKSEACTSLFKSILSFYILLSGCFKFVSMCSRQSVCVLTSVSISVCVCCLHTPLFNTFFNYVDANLLLPSCFRDNLTASFLHFHTKHTPGMVCPKALVSQLILLSSVVVHLNRVSCSFCSWSCCTSGVCL